MAETAAFDSDVAILGGTYPTRLRLDFCEQRAPRSIEKTKGTIGLSHVVQMLTESYCGRLKTTFC